MMLYRVGGSAAPVAMATLIACLAVSSSFAVSPKPIYEAVAGKLGPEGSAFGTQAFATSFAAALAKKCG
jgi:hypothetical protein